MGKNIIVTPKTKKVIRGIIVGIREDTSEREFLLFQRSKKVKRHRRLLECIGGAVLPEEDRKPVHTLVREAAEESDIFVTKVGPMIYEETRDWEDVEGDVERYEQYHVRFFLVETRPIKKVNLSDEHSGSLWLTMKEIARNPQLIRPSTYSALRELHITLYTEPRLPILPNNKHI